MPKGLLLPTAYYLLPTENMDTAKNLPKRAEKKQKNQKTIEVSTFYYYNLYGMLKHPEQMNGGFRESKVY